MTALSFGTSIDYRVRFQVLRSNTWQEEGGSWEAWERTMTKLQMWFDAPSALADEDIVPPTQETIQLAGKIARQERVQGRPAPTRVMPNGEAGIVLEWVIGPSRLTVEIERNHEVEVSLYGQGQRISRSRFNASATGWGC